MYVYEPSDDSWLLAQALKNRKCKRFLDMGCGTGVQANSILEAEEIVCADININAIEAARKNVKRKNVRFVVSDLFNNISGKFDLIAFNAPYLDESEPQDVAWTYMQNGEDVIKKFMREAKNHLTKNGAILLLISDRNYSEYKRFAHELNYTWKIISKKSLFFEKLFVIELVHTNT